MNENQINRIALFDFCETLVDFQTADAYVDFVRSNFSGSGKVKMILLEKIFLFCQKTRLISIVNKLTRGRYSTGKRLKLLQLKKISYSILDTFANKYYCECIKPHLIPKVVYKMIRLQKKGFKIILISGGYDIYLKYFTKEFGINCLISTKIGFNNDICTGSFRDKDCVNENKVDILETILLGKNYKYEYAFSDSHTDIPLLKLATEGYVVSHNRHQDWIDKYKFKEIIW